MTRLGVFLFYDPDGIVDDYVPFFLKSLKAHCDELAVVVNGALDESNLKKLTDVSDRVFLRDNTGFDSWAYKHVIEQYGYQALAQWDELLICNYTCYGPIYPFSELFTEMTRRNCDFWGMHRHPGQSKYRMAGHEIIEHVQSHFIVFRKSILQSPTFQEYWETLKPVTCYEEAIAYHELRCTPFFESRGFKSSCYIDPQKYFDFMPGYNASVLCAYKQTIEDRSPLLKRKVFFTRYARATHPLVDGFRNFDLIRFVRKNTDYDVRLIYQNIARTQDIRSMPRRAPGLLTNKIISFLARHGTAKTCKYFRTKLFSRVQILSYREFLTNVFGWSSGRKMERLRKYSN